MRTTSARSPAALLIAAGLLSLFTPEAGAERIRTAISQATLNYLSVYVAETRGFFKEEGIEHEVRLPMKIEEPIPPERLLHLKLVEEVRRELELKAGK